MDIKELLAEINEWQDKVFTKATPLSAAIHLEREAVELVEAIQLGHAQESIAEEMADIFFLLAGVSHLMGENLLEAIQKKFEINKAREWGKPDVQGVVEHFKGGVPVYSVDEPTKWIAIDTSKSESDDPPVNFMRLDEHGRPYGIGRTD